MSSPSKILNLPNILSLIRLIFVPITVWLLLEELYDFTFFIFIFCCLTDGLDGFIAKRFKLETNLGRILDPIADKALLMSVFLALGFEGFMESWIVIAAIFRDSLIIFGSILLYMFYNEYKIQPIFISKINTLFQFLLAVIIIGNLAFNIFHLDVIYLLELVVGITIIVSGVAYVVHWGRFALRMEEKR